VLGIGDVSLEEPWDLNTGEAAAPILLRVPVCAAIFTPDRQRFLDGCGDGRGRIWRLPGDAEQERPSAAGKGDF
jgi:hypothetical protein